MFQNIERKIKGLAKIWAGIGVVASIIGIILIFCDDGFYEPLVLSGVALLVSGVVFFFSSWLVYGFGQLIENTRPALSESKQEMSKQEFFCSRCGQVVHFGEKSCMNCGLQFDWSQQQPE